ncbi:MAG: hypothetical protein PHH14_06210 [Candidatus Margulisbacteria bacterium]|nr:hypothetical protein [Candidatus Margulisiibacteriota bacterium]
MNIIKGTNRIAIVGKSYTIKFVRIPFRAAIREVVSIAKNYHKYNWKAAKLAIKLTEFNGPFRGIWANYREWSASAQLGDNVVPTRFSFLDLFNVVETASLLNLPRLKHTYEYPGYGDVHTFREPGNYGWHKGKLKLLDYGSPKVIKYLLENGAQFRRQLDVFGIRHSGKIVGRVLNSKGQIFDAVLKQLKSHFPEIEDPRLWDIEDNETTFAQEVAKMSIRELEQAFIDLVGGRQPVIESSAHFLNGASPLISFLDSLSNSELECIHHFRSAIGRIAVIKSTLQLEERDGILTEERKLQLNNRLSNAFKYKAFIRELMIRWDH